MGRAWPRREPARLPQARRWLRDNAVMAGTGYYGHLAVSLGDVRGEYRASPVLQVELNISADGFAPGVAAMILPSCHVQGVRSPLNLGQGETIIVQLGFTPAEGGDKPYRTREYGRWNLTSTAVERLEEARGGGDLTIYVTPEVVMLNHGESLPDVRPRPAGVQRPSVYPHSPIRHAPQETQTVAAEAWVRQVLTPWQLAAAVTLVVKLPADGRTDDHRTVVRDLADARHRLDAGDWKGSVRASRDAAEVLRGMHKALINATKTLRTIDEREAAVLDADLALIQALFDYESATHPDPGLRDIAWTRQHAMLALTATAAVAQRLFTAP
jgi:hypothetical protein